MPFLGFGYRKKTKKEKRLVRNMENMKDKATLKKYSDAGIKGFKKLEKDIARIKAGKKVESPFDR